MSVEKNRTVIETTMMKMMSLQSASVMVPTYDGNSMTLTSYKQRLENAREFFNDSEAKLVQIAISKLRGKAVEAVEGIETKTIVQLIDALKIRFSPRRPFSFYQNRINHLCKFPEETASEYGIRSQRYLRCAIVALSYERQDTADFLTDALKKETIIAFVRGLPSEYDAYTKNNYEDLREVINDAIKAEIAIQDKEEIFADMDRERRYYHSTFNKDLQSREDNLRDGGRDRHQNPKNTEERYWRPTYFCEKDTFESPREQERKYCYFTRFNKHLPKMQMLYCQYCKMNNHSSEQCRRKPQERRFQQGTTHRFYPVSSEKRFTSNFRRFNYSSKQPLNTRRPNGFEWTDKDKSQPRYSKIRDIKQNQSHQMRFVESYQLWWIKEVEQHKRQDQVYCQQQKPILNNNKYKSCKTEEKYFVNESPAHYKMSTEQKPKHIQRVESGIFDTTNKKESFVAVRPIRDNNLSKKFDYNIKSNKKLNRLDISIPGFNIPKKYASKNNNNEPLQPDKRFDHFSVGTISLLTEDELVPSVNQITHEQNNNSISHVQAPLQHPGREENSNDQNSTAANTRPQTYFQQLSMKATDKNPQTIVKVEETLESATTRLQTKTVNNQRFPLGHMQPSSPAQRGRQGDIHETTEPVKQTEPLKSTNDSEHARIVSCKMTKQTELIDFPNFLAVPKHVQPLTDPKQTIHERTYKDFIPINLKYQQTAEQNIKQNKELIAIKKQTTDTTDIAVLKKDYSGSLVLNSASDEFYNKYDNYTREKEMNSDANLISLSNSTRRLIATNKSFLYRKGDCVIFTTSDCCFRTPNAQALIDLNYLDSKKIQSFKVLHPPASFYIINNRNHPRIILLFVKDHCYEKCSSSDLLTGLEILRNVMKDHKIPHVRLSLKGDVFDQVKNRIFRRCVRSVFNDRLSAITLCYGKIMSPREQDFYKITEE